MSPVQPPPAWALSTSWPLALAPVRLETRFAGSTLKIRVFPDQLAVDAHEPELTPAEVTAGKAYWGEVWRAAGDDEREAAAWERLSTEAGDARAPWVARALEPPATGRPTKPLESDAPLPDGLPDFPDVRTKPVAWMRPALGRWLPTRWFAVATLPGHAPRWGESLPVRPDLQVGPAPDAPGTPPTPVPEGTLAAPPGLDWVHDFARALDAGMALVIEDLPLAMQGRIDRLFVYGVDETASQQPLGAPKLAALLEAHAAVDGLGLLEPGAPTNNTETVRSAYASRSPSAQRAAIVRDDDAAPAAGATGRLARALGLPAASAGGPLEYVRQRPARTGAPDALRRTAAIPDDDAEVQDVQTALWMASWGYFLRHMMADAFPASLEPAMREHYRRFVRADGPLPVLRVGAQPYGVLPVMALDRWTSREPGPDHRPVVDLLRRLRDQVWLPSVASVPRLRHGVDQRDRVLVDVLGMDARPGEIVARSLLGPEYVTWLWRFARLRLDSDWEEQLSREPRDLLAALGLGSAADVVLTTTAFSGDAFPLVTPLVARGSREAKAAYVAGFAAAGLTAAAALAQPALPGGQETPLLYRLLRSALMLEHSLAADLVGAARGLPAAREPREPELVDIAPDELTATLWRRLGVPFTPAGGNPTTVGAYVSSGKGGDPALHRLREFRAAVGRMSAIPAGRLERHLADVLGLASTRLDAAITSYATRRLELLRSTQPEGVHLGAYGCVLDLRRASPRGTVANPPPGEPGPLSAAPPDSGHIHAPSVGQATTAAVLRSGWRARGGGSGNPLAVDLSSRRVRLAEFLLAGVRAGQPLGTLLGYRFERALHEHKRQLLDGFLPAFREFAPGLATEVGPDGRLRQAERPGAVVDGLALRSMRANIPWGSDGFPSADAADPDRAAVDDVLDLLDDSVDAVADALLAEAVHHAASGRPDSAGAMLDAVSRGEAPPPATLEFQRTPTPGPAISHRVVLAANAAVADRADWPAGEATSPRSVASPAADAVVAALLPAPGRVRCGLHWRGPDDATAASELRLTALGLAAIDYVCMPPRPSEPTGAELDQRIALAAWAAPPAPVGPGWELTLDFSRDPAWGPDVLSVAEFLDAVASAGRLLRESRALEPADLAELGGAAERAGDDLTVAPGIARVKALLEGAVIALRQSAEPGQRAALLLAAGAGVLGAVPPPPTTGNAAAVAEAAERTAAELERRLTAHADLGARPGPAGTPEQRLGHERLRLAALLGPEVPLLPTFAAPAPTALAASLGQSTALQAGDPWQASSWLQRYARVRTGAARMQESLTFARALGTLAGRRAEPPLRVAQLPHTVGDRWRALPRPAGTPGSGVLSLVVAAPLGLDPLQPVCGLAVDAWVERVPEPRLTTGLAFEFDAPGSAPPQAILLAVPADTAPVWTPAALEATLNETVDLVRLRGVDITALGKVGQFLPALYYPVNVPQPLGSPPTATTVGAASTDFTPDARPVAG